MSDGIRLPRLAGLCVLVFVCAGCGYKTASVYPSDVHSVHVAAFENDTFYDGLGVKLSEAVAKEIMARTPYRLGTREEAETVLDGRVREVNKREVTRRELGNVPAENQLTMRVNFAWTRAQEDGEALVSGRDLRAVGHHASSRPVDEPIAVGEEQVVQRMAKRIVDAMRETW